MKILVINCGSSSVKFKVFEMPEGEIIAGGNVEKIGEEISIFKWKTKEKETKKELKITSHQEALKLISETLTDEKAGVVKEVNEIKGVGHRVVHGGEGFEKSVIIDENVIKRIEEYIDLAPLHNPHNLAGIKASMKYFPESLQVASFDTAFHTTIPEVAYLYAIPYELYEENRVRRYGFHGTSHRYVARRYAEIVGKGKYEVNVITCHLGNGCSITAVKNGHSIDTSMGLTPLEGLVMGTRSGDIDPGIIFYLEERKGYSVKEINNLLNKKSGLLGISGYSNDFRNLMEKKDSDKRASLAIEIFCYRLKKYIGSYMAVLGKVDAIIFTAGIGENVPYVREKSLENMEMFGIEIDPEKNKETVGKEGKISTEKSKVDVYVIPTNEELAIASDTYQFIISKQKQETQ